MLGFVSAAKISVVNKFQLQIAPLMLTWLMDHVCFWGVGSAANRVAAMIKDKMLVPDWESTQITHIRADHVYIYICIYILYSKEV